MNGTLSELIGCSFLASLSTDTGRDLVDTNPLRNVMETVFHYIRAIIM